MYKKGRKKTAESLVKPKAVPGAVSDDKSEL